MKDFNFNVSSYIAGVRHAGSMSQSKREELWEDLLEERGPIFADHRVKEFVDDLIQYKKIKGDGVDLGGEIDLIARRGEEILLVEVKSANSRLIPMQIPGVGTCEKTWYQDPDIASQISRQVRPRRTIRGE